MSAFENPENLKLKHAILMAFDPFTNAELRKEAEEEYGWNLDDGAELEAYYQRPVQCVLRILDSAKKWIKERGSDSYFNFISAFIPPRTSRRMEKWTGRFPSRRRGTRIELMWTKVPTEAASFLSGGQQYGNAPSGRDGFRH